MIVLSLTLFFLYVKYIQKNVANVKVERTKEELQLHSLEEILNKVPQVEIPRIEMPEIDQEAVQELQKMMEEAPKKGVYEEPIE